MNSNNLNDLIKQVGSIRAESKENEHSASNQQIQDYLKQKQMDSSLMELFELPINEILSLMTESH